jgi:hypothetical protein
MKITVLCMVLAVALVGLAGCKPGPALEGAVGASGDGSAALGASVQVPEDEQVPVPPAVAMQAQEYEGGNVVEVPQLIHLAGSGGASAGALDEVNAAITGFAGDYSKYVSGGDDGAEWIELKAYPIQNEKYIQVVMTRAVFPSYGTQGDVFSVCYDYQTDTIYSLDEAVNAEGLDLVNIEKGLEQVLDDAQKKLGIRTFAPVAFALSQTGNVFFYKVTFNPPADGTAGSAGAAGAGDTATGGPAGDPPLEVIFARYTDGSFAPYDGKTLPLGNIEPELVPMNPPLSWEK